MILINYILFLNYLHIYFFYNQIQNVFYTILFLLQELGRNHQYNHLLNQNKKKTNQIKSNQKNKK